MSEIIPQQDVMPLSMIRLCFHCSKPLSYVDHIYEFQPKIKLKRREYGIKRLPFEDQIQEIF